MLLARSGRRISNCPMQSYQSLQAKQNKNLVVEFDLLKRKAILTGKSISRLD